jgi:hypothetical protein
MAEPLASSKKLPPQEPNSTTKAEKKAPSLSWSDVIGKPSYLLDPKDLPGAYNLAPRIMGKGIKLVDDRNIVKHGRNVRLAEAEVLNLVSEKTTIPCPKVEAAYILDGVGYIIMSYEPGRPFDKYWDDASDDQRENLIAQLKDYAT